MELCGISSDRKDVTAYSGTMKIMRTMYLCGSNRFSRCKRA